MTLPVWALGLLVLICTQTPSVSSIPRQDLPKVWTYICREESCQRVEWASNPAGVPLDVCKLNCQDESPYLFPLPTGQVTVGKGITGVHRSKVTISGYEGYPVAVRQLFQDFDAIFHGYLQAMDPVGETPPEFGNNDLAITLDSMLGVFDNDLFHMGGDEVDSRCYNSTKEITDWMMERNITTDKEGFVDLWGIFQQRAYDLLLGVSADKEMKTILWTSELTTKEHVKDHLDSSKYIIQIWTDAKSEMISDLISNNYTTILSNYDALYLDCGFHTHTGGPGHNWCSPYNTWQMIYDNSPYEIYKNLTSEQAADDALQKGLMLGAESLLWTELVHTK